MEENGMYNMEKQHKLGKLHALERICMLLDEDSFREIGSNITNLEDAFNIKKGSSLMTALSPATEPSAVRRSLFIRRISPSSAVPLANSMVLRSPMPSGLRSRAAAR